MTHPMEAGLRTALKYTERKPSVAQAEAGNYAKGKFRWHGLEIAIENPKGSERSGVDKGGKTWRVKMPAHYGYVLGTVGRDKDHVDVYIGGAPHARTVFVIDQIDAKTGKFDEHKAFLNFPSKDEALLTYGRAFSDGKAKDRLGAVNEMTIDQFKRWVTSADTKKPLGHQAKGYKAGGAVNALAEPIQEASGSWFANLPRAKQAEAAEAVLFDSLSSPWAPWKGGAETYIPRTPHIDPDDYLANLIDRDNATRARNAYATGGKTMPLIKSGSKAAISQNIKTEMTVGNKPQKQAVAIALDTARRYAKKASGGWATHKASGGRVGFVEGGAPRVPVSGMPTDFVPPAGTEVQGRTGLDRLYREAQPYPINPRALLQGLLMTLGTRTRAPGDVSEIVKGLMRRAPTVPPMGTAAEAPGVEALAASANQPYARTHEPALTEYLRAMHGEPRLSIPLRGKLDAPAKRDGGPAGYAMGGHPYGAKGKHVPGTMPAMPGMGMPGLPHGMHGMPRMGFAEGGDITPKTVAPLPLPRDPNYEVEGPNYSGPSEAAHSPEIEALKDWLATQHHRASASRQALDKMPFLDQASTVGSHVGPAMAEMTGLPSIYRGLSKVVDPDSDTYSRVAGGGEALLGAIPGMSVARPAWSMAKPIIAGTLASAGEPLREDLPKLIDAARQYLPGFTSSAHAEEAGNKAARFEDEVPKPLKPTFPEKMDRKPAEVRQIQQELYDAGVLKDVPDPRNPGKMKSPVDGTDGDATRRGEIKMWERQMKEWEGAKERWEERQVRGTEAATKQTAAQTTATESEAAEKRKAAFTKGEQETAPWQSGLRTAAPYLGLGAGAWLAAGHKIPGLGWLSPQIAKYLPNKFAADSANRVAAAERLIPRSIKPDPMTINERVSGVNDFAKLGTQHLPELPGTMVAGAGKKAVTTSTPRNYMPFAEVPNAKAPGPYWMPNPDAATTAQMFPTPSRGLGRAGEYGFNSAMALPLAGEAAGTWYMSQRARDEAEQARKDQDFPAYDAAKNKEAAWDVLSGIGRAAGFLQLTKGNRDIYMRPPERVDTRKYNTAVANIREEIADKKATVAAASKKEKAKEKAQKANNPPPPKGKGPATPSLLPPLATSAALGSGPERREPNRDDLASLPLPSYDADHASGGAVNKPSKHHSHFQPRDKMNRFAGGPVYERNKGSQVNKTGTAERVMGGDAALETARRYAKGGAVRVGAIVGATGGRTDALPVDVPAGAFVLPADIVSALGEGNSLAGAKALDKMFGKQSAKKGHSPIGIKISDGEWVVSPEPVARIGHGSMEAGHRALDRFVIETRKKHVAQLNSLPPPAA